MLFNKQEQAGTTFRILQNDPHFQNFAFFDWHIEYTRQNGHNLEESWKQLEQLEITFKIMIFKKIYFFQFFYKL